MADNNRIRGERQRRRSCRVRWEKDFAYTLVEIVAVVAIMGILATLVFRASTTLAQRAEKPVCIANLKALYQALSTYVADNQQWPQLPKDIELDTPAEDVWWRTNLAPYGMAEKAWTCPTLRRTARQSNAQDALKENHYVPTIFDKKPNTPFKWPKMPWAMEVGNNHGGGLLVLMMDGSIVPYPEFYERSKN